MSSLLGDLELRLDFVDVVPEGGFSDITIYDKTMVRDELNSE